MRDVQHLVIPSMRAEKKYQMNREFLLEEIAGDAFNFGYRKLTKVLRRKYNLTIIEKKVYRLCKELGVLRPQRQKKVSYPRKLARNHIIKPFIQLREADIKYGYIEGEDRIFFVMFIIDVYERGIIAYHMGLSCTGDDVKQTLKRALLKRQQYDKMEKPVIRTDNGPQFNSYSFEEFCENSKMERKRILPRRPNMNVHIESFHRIFEDDCLSKWQFENYGEVYQEVMNFLVYYNERLMHSSLLDLSQKEFYQN